MTKPAPPLSLLWGPNTFQTFKDAPNADVRPEILHGEWAALYPHLDRLNRRGAGIYFTPNGCDGRGRKSENVIELRSWFVDIDGIPDERQKRGMVRRLLEHELEPSAIVETRSGLHAYWYAVPGQPVDATAFRQVEEGLIGYWGGDKSAKDLPRVLRVPGFLHQKTEQPFIITTLFESPMTFYLAEELLTAFPPPKPAYTPHASRRERIDASDAWGQVVNALAYWRPVQLARHRVMTIACGVAWKFGVSEAEAVNDLMPIVTGWDTGRDMATELKRTARWAYQRAEPATVKALRGEGVDVPKLRAPDASR